SQRIDSTFSPVLPFSVTRARVKINAQPASLPPGATYAPATVDPVHTSAAGAITTRASNRVVVARQQVRVGTLRTIGIVLASLALLTLVLRRRFSPPVVVDLVQQATKDCLVIDVVSLDEIEGRRRVEV